MASLVLHSDSSKPRSSSFESARNNPIVAYIRTQKARGIPQSVMMENLMAQGYSYRNIKNAFKVLETVERGALDWRSPTAINATGRMIRRDIRAGRVSYARGMRILLQARDNLQSLISSPRDPRLKQIKSEIRVTKKLLLQTHANPLMVQQYKPQ